MNFAILFVAICWAFFYNDFFGWNITSQSYQELICDGIFCIIFSLSIK